MISYRKAIGTIIGLSDKVTVVLPSRARQSDRGGGDKVTVDKSARFAVVHIHCLPACWW